MHIYKFLKGSELQLGDIPEQYREELQLAIDSGFVKVRYDHEIPWYSLATSTIVDPGEPDERDYKYSIIYRASLPKTSHTIKAAEDVEWVSQGSRNTCAAWTTVECKRILDIQKFPDYYTNPTNKVITRTTADGSIVNDLPKNYFSAENIFQRANGTTEGASPQKALNAARSYMLLEYDQPTTISGSHIYTEHRETVKYYTPENHKIDGYAACSSFKQIIDALNIDKPIFLCYALTTGYNQVMMGQTDELQDGDIIGYHASCCVGYETRNDQLYLKIQQTYEGTFKYNYMSESYYKKYNKHAWAILDQEETKLIQNVITIQKEMNDPTAPNITPSIPTIPTIKPITQPTKPKISMPKITLPKISIPSIKKK